jgi:hypothetical protein
MFVSASWIWLQCIKPLYAQVVISDIIDFLLFPCEVTSTMSLVVMASRAYKT